MLFFITQILKSVSLFFIPSVNRCDSFPKHQHIYELCFVCNNEYVKNKIKYQNWEKRIKEKEILRVMYRLNKFKITEFEPMHDL